MKIDREINIKYTTKGDKKMKGAKEYYDLFKGKSQQIGRLFFQFHTHARGKCLEIYLLPDGVLVNSNRIGSTTNVVEIYGMISGQRGWTEEYGWLYKGKWQDDFNNIIEQKLAEEIENKKQASIERIKDENNHKQNINKLLDSYN